MLHLIFYIESHTFSIDINSIAEIIPLVELKRAANTPDYIAGLCNYRGNIIPVVDLSMLIAGKEAERMLSTRIIIVKYISEDGGEKLLGLLAERVTETMHCDSEMFQTQGIETLKNDFLGDIMLRESNIIQNINVSKIIPGEMQQVPGRYEIKYLNGNSDE